MNDHTDEKKQAWLDAWMLAASRENAMTQRKVSVIEARGGGLEAAARSARQAGIHLVMLVDEHGERIVAASRHPFQVLT